MSLALKQVESGRRPIIVTWEPGDHDGEVALFFTNPEDNSDVSNTDSRANDGEAVVSVPEDFSGDIDGEVRTLDGDVIDSGTITL